MTTVRYSQPSWGPNVGDITNVDLIESCNIKLPIQLVLKYRLFMMAVSCDLVLFPVPHLHTRFSHQASSLPATNRITLCIQRFSDSATAVAMMTGFCYVLNCSKHFPMARVGRTIVSTTNVIIVGTPAYTHESAHQTDWVGLFPVGDKRIFHFVSFAKKTVASFNISLSSLSCLIWAFNCRISSCSGVSFPLPRNA